MTLTMYGVTFTIEMWQVALFYLVGFPVVTYLHLGLYYWINGGTSGRHPFWFPYQNLWQDIEWNFLPGREERRIAWMKKLIDDGNGWFCGVDYDDIRSGNLYLKMSYKITNKREFLFRMFRVLLVAAIASPFVVPIVVYMMVSFPIIVAADKLWQLWQRSFMYMPPL